MDMAEIRKRAKERPVIEDAEIVEDRPSADIKGGASGPYPRTEPASEEGDLKEATAEVVSVPAHPVKIVEPVQEKSPPAQQIDSKEGLVEVIAFLIDDEEYGIDIHGLKEVIRSRELTEVPHSPKDILGIISLRGVVIPVMNLRTRLGMQAGNGEGRRIIIVRDGDSLMGLLVDSVKGVVRIPEKALEPAPIINGVDSGFIKGIGRYPDGMFILLDTNAILEEM